MWASPLSAWVGIVRRGCDFHYKEVCRGYIGARPKVGSVPTERMEDAQATEGKRKIIRLAQRGVYKWGDIVAEGQRGLCNR